MDQFKMDQFKIEELVSAANKFFFELINDIDFTNRNLQIAIGLILFNPIYWNIMARLEHKTHFLTKIFGSAKNGCYFLAFTIFSLGLIRDDFYNKALSEQPTFSLFLQPEYENLIKSLGLIIFSIGSILVVSSMYKLGITGTYLGDYFGILMSKRVVSFPFNVCSNPMYNGSSLCFLGTALWYGKPAGLLATLVVFSQYQLALLFEEPYTAKIYADKEATKKR
ncbi:hypothetical protein PACTADRAFT_4066 [Pachysolen tannophilus NRRL Y-2460]|uniref:Phosphatidyl-N-methylethanolamine N-methyltransferase n=1 Tax=Pachysolen tannophilus NRRL Y-2460 TaxID=669874 RepID=A0A1E4TQR2_PACTA|nr:hypothetical protein PACTADRAFT_4066 [Pachysolen tannophilus NRRL Y-2460]